ncbi:MAG: TrkH family potassium uptake protein [Lachnospiraceae bacterium]|nr:TrkH family potassium uptake protein [Lachnospiraceae bacterium]
MKKNSIILYIVGVLLLFESAFLLLPMLVSFIYSDGNWMWYLITTGICLALGIPLTRVKPGKNLSLKEGYIIVALCWLVLSLVGALPFVMSGDIPDYIDALFETVSGFTTTGASILSDVEVLSRSGMFWRSFMHWVGGMGVFMFMMAVLPMLGTSDMNLMKAESTGPSVERIVPHVRDTARLMYGMYFGITLAEILSLLVSGMDLYSSLLLTFGSVGTGGFGLLNSSCGAYTPAQQIIISFFMAASGINYTFYFFIISGKVKEAFHIEEVKYYIGIIIVSTLVIAANIGRFFGSYAESLRHAFFQVASIITTTGYSTVDFDAWPELSRMILLLLMMIGGCSGSTAGGIKVYRVVLLMKQFRKELSVLRHPREVKVLRMDGGTVKESVMRSTNVFISIYFVIFFISLILISVENFDFTTGFTAVAATINNIGPGLSMVGPACNYGFFSTYSKVILIFDMLTGRLELFPVLLLLSMMNPRISRRKFRKKA